MRIHRQICIAVLILLLIAVPQFKAADTLPERLSDEAFWKLVESLSEKDGEFLFDNFVSNELRYPDAVSNAQKAVKPGGVYLGVGPEQNFHYIAALQPKIAFIMDIRRQNLIEHLMYKAIFELSANRVEFVSRLFARRPVIASVEVPTAKDLMQALAAQKSDESFEGQNVQEIRELLARHGFRLSDTDQSALNKIRKAFFDSGAAISYATGTTVTVRPGINNPSFADLMTAVDANGKNWSFLDSEPAFRVVKEMESRNLIVPVVGDFAGPDAMRKTGQYLKDNSAVVSMFYVSNVETYFFITLINAPGVAPNGGPKNYFANIAALPIDATSLFLRAQGAVGPGLLFSIQKNLAAFLDGKITNTGDLYRQ